MRARPMAPTSSRRSYVSVRCGRAACLRPRPASAVRPIGARDRRPVPSDCSAGPRPPVPDLPRRWRSNPSRDTTGVSRTDLTPRCGSISSCHARGAPRHPSLIGQLLRLRDRPTSAKPMVFLGSLARRRTARPAWLESAHVAEVQTSRLSSAPTSSTSSGSRQRTRPTSPRTSALVCRTGQYAWRVEARCVEVVSWCTLRSSHLRACWAV
jgi:hypothetical protein